MIYKILVSVIVVLMFSNDVIWSQSPAGGAGNSGATSGQAPSPGDFPPLMSTPREDLDNYNYSNMDESNFSGQREDLGNFGKPLMKKNNVEINAELKKMEEERKGKAKSPEDKDAVPGDVEGEAAIQPDGNGFIQPGDSTSLFRWVDSDGILHVTDDFGSVPKEYRDQVINR